MRRRTRWLGPVLAVTTLAGGGVAYSAGQGGSAPAEADPGPATATATVEKGDLVVAETIEGTLGYSGGSAIAGKASGTVTWLPAKGAVVRRGERLYGVDGQPVFLLYGKVPAYRALTVGTEGADVLQLERNLQALGYGDDLEVDDTYTSYTAAAVRDWQEDRGLSETGEVDLGTVVFQPGAVRVAGHETTLGADVGAGQAVITGSGLDRVVSVDLPVEQRPLAKESARVRVTLPDGTTVDGRVTSVGTVAETTGEGEEEETTFEVRISLSDPEAAGSLDQAPVDVSFESERHKDVLSVPVNALVALPDGGYGVVVVDEDGPRTVEVDLGVFSNGRVEVAGGGLRAGMLVEVPAS